MTEQQKAAIRGARDMLRESANQFRLAGDTGHATVADGHAGNLERWFDLTPEWKVETYDPTQRKPVVEWDE